MSWPQQNGTHEPFFIAKNYNQHLKNHSVQVLCAANKPGTSASIENIPDIVGGEKKIFSRNM